jgi:hypothetical protein
VARNVVSDSTIGIEASGDDWIIAGNLLYDIKPSDGNVWGTLAIFTYDYASYLDIEWNTIVDATNSYDDRSTYTNTRCNVVLQTPESFGYAKPRGLQTATAYNYVYESGFFNFSGPTNAYYPSAGSSLNETLCYDRRRWTGVETVCVPRAGTTMGSPHLVANKDCNANIAEPFGIGPISFWQNRPPPPTCGLGAELVGVLAMLRRAMRRRDADRRPS